jgi:hypothetical protein
MSSKNIPRWEWEYKDIGYITSFDVKLLKKGKRDKWKVCK